MTITNKERDVIKVKDIDSTNVAKLEFVKTKKELKVIYHHGGKYLYKDVSKKEFEQIIQADSIGKEVREICIKGNKEFTKL